MATWITHLMIADGVLERIPNLDRHGKHQVPVPGKKV